MRDYHKEYLWEKKKYDYLKIKLDYELGQKFREKLKIENKTISGFIIEKIKNYTKI